MSLLERAPRPPELENDEPPASEAQPARRVGTSLPRRDLDDAPDDSGRVVVGASRDEFLSVAGAGLAGLALGLVFTVGLGLVPVGWLLVISYIWFVGIYSVLVFLRNPGPAVVDRFWSIMLWSAAVVVVGTLALVIGFTLVSGRDVFVQIFADDAGSISNRLHFFWQDMGTVGPLSGLEVGGIVHALVGTLEQIGIALAITVPLGLTTAVFLGEVGGRFARFVRTIVEAMTALPSVVAGLFIYAAVIIAFTHQFNGFAAALAITVLMLPIMIRSADVVLRLVPGNLREAGLALGAGQWAVVWYVVLPTVRSGLTTAIILGTAHGIGETAPVLLTAGVTSNLNFDPFNGPQTSLPLAALEFVKAPQPEMRARGFATAAFLLLVVLVLFVVARAIGGREAGSLTPRQRAQLSMRSRGTLARIQSSLQQAEADATAAGIPQQPPQPEPPASPPLASPPPTTSASPERE